MKRPTLLAVVLIGLAASLIPSADVAPPNGGKGAGTVPLWNPHRPVPGNPPLTIRVLVLNYDPLVPAEKYRRLSEVFRWNNPARLATDCKEAMEYASGGYLRFDIVEWRNLNEIYAQEGGHRYTIEQYVRNRRTGKGWREHGMADYPRLLHEQNVVPLVDDGLVDEVWVFSDHFFGVFEASMAGPGAFFINGGVYPQVPSRRPFAFYGFNYERGVAEMMHDASHRTESTMNRAYGPWNLKDPKNNWEKFSANHDQSGGVAGVGTCHWPANAKGDYDYGNPREVASWADAFLSYPKLKLVRKQVSRATWSRGPDYHLDYMKWYFAHIPRAAGVNVDGRQNNWFKYIFDFQSYDAKGQPLPASAELHARDVADSKAAAHTLTVAYRSADQIDPASLGDDDLSVTGPDGKPLVVRLVSGKEAGGRSYRVAKYKVTAPGGSWEKAPAGDYAVSLRPDRIRTGTGTILAGKRLGSFRVARADSKPAPLATDKYTTLLAHFEGSAAGGKGKTPLTAKGLRYEPGVVGRGVVIGKGSELRYRSAGALDPKAGTIEFWVRPKWDGNSGTSHVFFQAGQPFNNGLLIQIDGANNLRLMTWGDDPATEAVEKSVERGIGTSAAGWKADEWHHVAATWEQSGRRLALYVDGRLVETTTNGIVIPALSLPHFWFGSGAGGASPAEAVLDELRISRRARTENEIRATATASRGVETLTVEMPSGPLLAGDRAVARAFGRTKAGLKQDLTRDVAWTSSDAKVATVDEIGTLRAGQAGQATLTARIGGRTATASVKVIDPGLPKARLLKAPDVTRAGAGDVTIVVEYEDQDGIRSDSLGLGNVRVTGPHGFQQFPALVTAKASPAGRKVTASYRVVPPAGKWQKTDQGTYTIEIKAFQVADAKGNHVPEGVLGRFQVLPPAK
jgi:hypothetical protein